MVGYIVFATLIGTFLIQVYQNYYYLNQILLYIRVRGANDLLNPWARCWGVGWGEIVVVLLCCCVVVVRVGCVRLTPGRPRLTWDPPPRYPPIYPEIHPPKKIENRVKTDINLGFRGFRAHNLPLNAYSSISFHVSFFVFYTFVFDFSNLTYIHIHIHI